MEDIAQFLSEHGARRFDLATVRRHLALDALTAANDATGGVRRPTRGVIARDELVGTPEWHARYNASHLIPTAATEAPNGSRPADESFE